MEMIPADQVERSVQRARRAIGWLALSNIALLALYVFLIITFRGQLVYVSLAVIGFMFALLFWTFSGLCFRCPSCRHKIPQAFILKMTRRCPRCHVVVVEGEFPPESDQYLRSRRNMRIRVLIFLSLIAMAAPIGAYWLNAKQLLAPNDWWKVVLYVWSSTGFLSVPVLFGALADKMKKARLSKDAPLVPRYPTLALGNTSKWRPTVFRTYFVPEMLCFARVANDFYDDDNPATLVVGGVFLLFIERSLRQKRRREAIYDMLDPASNEMLAVDPKNFRIARESVRSINFVPLYKCDWKRRLSYASCSGILTVELTDRPAAHFVLVGNLSEPEVNVFLQKWWEPSNGKDAPIGHNPVMR